MLRLALMAVALFLFSCTEEKKKEIIVEKPIELKDFKTYKLVGNSSDVHQAAARAVVKVELPVGAGTGFFVNDSGMLMTNEHVIGSSHCTQQGCFVTLVFDFQANVKYDESNSKKVFLKPLYVNKSLDVSLYQAYQFEGGEKLDTSSRSLQFRKVTARELYGNDLYVIGHPLGGLKKVKKAKVTTVRGPFIILDDFMFGGNSGSPIVDENGKVVGIVHRSADGTTALSPDGMQGFSIGSASESLLQDIWPETLAVSQINTAHVSVKKVLVDFENKDVALKMRLGHLSALDRLPKDIQLKGIVDYVTAAGKECDEAMSAEEIDNIWQVNSTQASCLAPLGLVECRNGFSKQSYQICNELSNEEIEKWKKRYSDIFDVYVKSFEHFPETLVAAAGAFGMTGKLGSSQPWLSDYLEHVRPKMDFDLALRMISRGMLSSSYVSSPKGFIQNYSSQEAYWRHWEKILMGEMLVIMSESEAMSKDELSRRYNNWVARFDEAFAHRGLTFAQRFTLEVLAHVNGVLKVDSE